MPVEGVSPVSCGGQAVSPIEDCPVAKNAAVPTRPAGGPLLLDAENLDRVAGVGDEAVIGSRYIP